MFFHPTQIGQRSRKHVIKGLSESERYRLRVERDRTRGVEAMRNRTPIFADCYAGIIWWVSLKRRDRDYSRAKAILAVARQCREIHTRRQREQAERIASYSRRVE